MILKASKHIFSVIGLFLMNVAGSKRVSSHGLAIALGEKLAMSNHSQHLCEYSRHHGVEEMRERVKNPKWICEVCGRAANKKEFLCRPVKM
jgi:hypothetical protein